MNGDVGLKTLSWIRLRFYVARKHYFLLKALEIENHLLQKEVQPKDQYAADRRDYFLIGLSMNVRFPNEARTENVRIFDLGKCSVRYSSEATPIPHIHDDSGRRVGRHVLSLLMHRMPRSSRIFDPLTDPRGFNRLPFPRRI